MFTVTMAHLKMMTCVVMVVLATSTADPPQNTTLEGEGGSFNESVAEGTIGSNLPINEEEPPRQRPRPRILFNDYLLEAYKVALLAKETNCSDEFIILNQTVSEYFCESNKTIYSFLNSTIIYNYILF